jgi:hypothetical protein
MLISIEELIDYLKLHNITFNGVLHVGAHECEELDFYNKLNIKNENIIWIEAIPNKVIEAQQRGILNVYNELITNIDNEETVFYISNNVQSSSVLELYIHLEEHPTVEYVDKIKLNSITIDTFYNKYNLDASKYTLWNFDIQGAELLALKGAINSIQYVRAIYIEVNEKELYKNCCLIKDIDDFLHEYNFKRVLTKMTTHGWGDALYIR